MKGLLRQAALLAVSAALSWWFFLRVPAPRAAPRPPLVVPATLEVTPLLRDPESTAATGELVARASEQAPQELDEPEAPPPAALTAERLFLPEARQPEPPPTGDALEAPAAASASPPSELGTPEGDEGEEPGLPAPEADPGPPETVSLAASADRNEEPVGTATQDAALEPDPPDERAPASGSPPQPPSLPASGEARGEDGPHAQAATSAREAQAARTVEGLMQDPRLLEEARSEFTRGNRKGFATVLLAAPEDQLEIARFFGEDLVLVPRRTLDPGAGDPGYFRLQASGEPRVERVAGVPALEGYRQYRDLFDYDYGRLPLPLRELRRSVPGRGEIYLFAALLSAEEWALVIARRREALALEGRELSDVRRFVLRYLRLPGGGFDLGVEEIVLADGTRLRPAQRGNGARKP